MMNPTTMNMAWSSWPFFALSLLWMMEQRRPLPVVQGFPPSSLHQRQSSSASLSSSDSLLSFLSSSASLSASSSKHRVKSSQISTTTRFRCSTIIAFARHRLPFLWSSTSNSHNNANNSDYYNEALETVETNDELIPWKEEDHEFSISSSAQLQSLTFAYLPRATTTETTSDHDAGDDQENHSSSSSSFLDPDLLCDYLLELGACSASIVDANAGTPLESPIFREVSSSFLLMSDQMPDWAHSLWKVCNVTALFPASIHVPAVLQQVSQTFGGGGGNSGSRDDHNTKDDDNDDDNDDDQNQLLFAIPPTIATLPDRDWVVHVQSTWEPIVVSCQNIQFVLRFPWHSNRHVQRALLNHATAATVAPKQPPEEEQQNLLDHSSQQENVESTTVVDLLLQGGIAFGTGEHDTTQLCLQWLAQVVPRVAHTTTRSYGNDDENNSNPIWVLDYGTGSGILGLAACKLDPRVRCVGIDIDVDACHIANENVRLNGLERNRMSTYLPAATAAAPATNSNLDGGNDSGGRGGGGDGDDDGDDDSKALFLKAVYRQEQQQNQQKQQPQSSSLFIEQQQQDTPKQYHICVANILAEPLVSLAPSLVDQLYPGGLVGLSGILNRPSIVDSVLKAYTNAGLQDVCVAQSRPDWVLITGVKPSR
ncbi:hypothetical protein ACA910_003094 [Epithemia clementina (nom. ined.)]